MGQEASVDADGLPVSGAQGYPVHTGSVDAGMRCLPSSGSSYRLPSDIRVCCGSAGAPNRSAPPGVESPEAMERQYDWSLKEEGFVEGTHVWFYNARQHKGMPLKLHSPWEGPYRVVECVTSPTVFSSALAANTRSSTATGYGGIIV